MIIHYGFSRPTALAFPQLLFLATMTRNPSLGAVTRPEDHPSGAVVRHRPCNVIETQATCSSRTSRLSLYCHAPRPSHPYHGWLMHGVVE